MSMLSIIGSGVAVFLAMAVASFPFGFVQGFASSQGRPLSKETLARLRIPEYTIEFVLVVCVLATYATRIPETTYVDAMGAVAVATCLLYLLDVRKLGMSMKELWVRFFVGALVCAPLGLALGVVRGVSS